jgi:hypothetical protein
MLARVSHAIRGVCIASPTLQRGTCFSVRHRCLPATPQVDYCWLRCHNPRQIQSIGLSVLLHCCRLDPPHRTFQGQCDLCHKDSPISTVQASSCIGTAQKPSRAQGSSVLRAIGSYMRSAADVGARPQCGLTPSTSTPRCDIGRETAFVLVLAFHVIGRSGNKLVF